MPSYGPFPGGEGAHKFKMNKGLHTITSLSVTTGWQAHKIKQMNTELNTAELLLFQLHR